MKVIYIIPGFFEEKREYALFKNDLQRAGWKVYIVPIVWKYRTVTNWLQQVHRYFALKDLSEAAVLGFSAGGLLLPLFASQHGKIGKIILCSIPHSVGSSMTAETERYISFLGIRRIRELKKIDLRAVLRKMQTPHVTFVYGEQESKKLISQVKKISCVLPHSSLVMIPNTIHNIHSDSYRKGLLEGVL